MSLRLGVRASLLSIALSAIACSDSSPAPPVAPPDDAGAPSDANAPETSAPVDAAPPDPPLGKNPYGAAYPTLHLGWRVREGATPGEVIPNLTFVGLLPGATTPSRVQMADAYDPEGRTHDLVVVCLINLDGLADSLLGPIAASSAPAKARESRARSASRSKKVATPVGLVKQTRSKPPEPNRSRDADRCGSPGSTASVLDTGISTTSPPSRRSLPARAGTLSRARVTTTDLPWRGRFSNQASCSRLETTSPTTTRDGGFRPAALACSAIVARVPATTRWEDVVPCSITAAG